MNVIYQTMLHFYRNRNNNRFHYIFLIRYFACGVCELVISYGLNGTNRKMSITNRTQAIKCFGMW